MDNTDIGGTLSVSCNTDALESADLKAWLPSHEQLTEWAMQAFRASSLPSRLNQAPELSVAMVDTHTMRELNNQYRGIDKPTNVLSFSALDDIIDTDLQVDGLLGDVIVCPQIVHDEALAQGKPVEHHFAHLVVHGVLHLSGMDHHEEKEALAMEQAEIRILSKFGIPDPYNSVFNQPT